MAWIAVDFDGEGWLFQNKPHREGEGWFDDSNDLREMTSVDEDIIETLVGRRLTWDDEPVEVVTGMNSYTARSGSTGFCEICGQEGPMYKTLFYFPVKCECCVATVEGNRMHMTTSQHCSRCAPKPPGEISPVLRDSEGNVYRMTIPMKAYKIEGRHMIDGRILGMDI